ncbi:MAG: hypothetical protein H0X24_00255 [Ktedonobacterales bacterium]|nr:hypothetical protein [Ktedonobacterales bacterium]
MIHDLTILPLPNNSNVYAALRMFAEDDPCAGIFARGVLQAFGQQIPDDHHARLRALLAVWDTVPLEHAVVVYDPAVIAAARAQVYSQ